MCVLCDMMTIFEFRLSAFGRMHKDRTLSLCAALPYRNWSSVGHRLSSSFSVSFVFFRCFSYTIILTFAL